MAVFSDDGQGQFGIGGEEVVTQTQLVQNGSFAGGAAGWTAAGQVAYNAQGQASPDHNAAQGETCAELTVNTYGSGSASLKQTLTLPKAGRLQLSFNFQGFWSGTGSSQVPGQGPGSVNTVPYPSSFIPWVAIGTAPGKSDVLSWVPGAAEIGPPAVLLRSSQRARRPK